MYNKHYYLLVIFFLATYSLVAQDCGLTISGRVLDENSGDPLSFVHVVIQEEEEGVFTNDAGEFSLTSQCQGHYHLIFSHIGCDPILFHLDLESDTLLNIVMDHSSISLESVVIEGQSADYSSQSSQSIGVQQIEDNSHSNLSRLLENQAGVASLKNGSGIAKPIVHGLFGNRLPILNNGIAQSGQQWGNDHSPEIDPLTADKITLIKGASALEYFGNNMGSLILVEPKKVGFEPHLHGRVGYAYESNGRGSNLNLRMHKGLEQFSWRINGTLKSYGDRQTPDYFLNNTGTREKNLAVQLEKNWNGKLFVDFYGSTFNAELGILRGSHIGNLTDLESALSREVPFFTEPVFSDTIEAPRQEVDHHLLKLKAKYFIEDNKNIEFVLAGQLNNRQEYDVRRGGLSDTPALNLRQYSYTTELKYTTTLASKWRTKIGNQNNFVNNFNIAGTGVLPLIPDYFAARSGWFLLLSKEADKLNTQLGANYQYEHQRVAVISRTQPVEVVRYTNNFHSANAMLGLEYKLSDIQRLVLNTGLAMRNPAINELYSSGLHQGVSGIEEGDINLETERALKTTLEYKIIKGSKLSVSTLAYFQRFQNYILLSPQEELRLTIRGAFPVFKYEQTAAEIYGLDISSQFSLGEFAVGKINYSYIQGNDLDKQSPLINIPTSTLYGGITYNIGNTLNLSKLTFDGTEIEAEVKYVTSQDARVEALDFVAPPASYYVLGARFSSNLILPKNRLRFFLRANNLLNVNYRDYLNRQRYFADAAGRSIVAGLILKF